MYSRTFTMYSRTIHGERLLATAWLRPKLKNDIIIKYSVQAALKDPNPVHMILIQSCTLEYLPLSSCSFQDYLFH